MTTSNEDPKQSRVRVLNAYSLNGNSPATPATYAGTLSTFGLPTLLKQQHRSLSKVINSIPTSDLNNLPARSMFIEAVSDMNKFKEEAIQEVCSQLAIGSAQQEMLDKRINQMTPADLILDSSTPVVHGNSITSIANEVLKEERERFAKLEANPKRESNEWAVLEDEVDQSFGPA